MDHLPRSAATRSKLGRILDLIDGSAIMDVSPLAYYHAAAAARDANRRRDLTARLQGIKTALHPYRVMVAGEGDAIRIFRPDTQQEIRL